MRKGDGVPYKNIFFLYNFFIFHRMGKEESFRKQIPRTSGIKWNEKQ